MFTLRLLRLIGLRYANGSDSRTVNDSTLETGSTYLYVRCCETLLFGPYGNETKQWTMEAIVRNCSP